MSIVRMEPSEYLNRQRFGEDMALAEQREIANAYGAGLNSPINIWSYNPYQNRKSFLGNNNGNGGGMTANTALLAITLPVIIFGVAVLVFAGYALHKYSKPAETTETPVQPYQITEARPVTYQEPYESVRSQYRTRPRERRVRGSFIL